MQTTGTRTALSKDRAFFKKPLSFALLPGRLTRQLIAKEVVIGQIENEY